VGTLVLTRFVAPDEYGTISIAAVAVTTVSAVTSLGFGQYVVANPKEGDRTTFHATVYHLGLGLVALAAVWAASGWLGAWFDAPMLARYMPAILIAAALDRVAYIPGRVLARDMRFKTLGLRLLLGELSYVLVAVTLAELGWGGWALALGMLARAHPGDGPLGAGGVSARGRPRGDRAHAGGSRAPPSRGRSRWAPSACGSGSTSASSSATPRCASCISVCPCRSPTRCNGCRGAVTI
jgi:hypothetical protein